MPPVPGKAQLFQFGSAMVGSGEIDKVATLQMFAPATLIDF